ATPCTSHRGSGRFYVFHIMAEPDVDPYLQRQALQEMDRDPVNFLRQFTGHLPVLEVVVDRLARTQNFWLPAYQEWAEMDLETLDSSGPDSELGITTTVPPDPVCRICVVGFDSGDAPTVKVATVPH